MTGQQVFNFADPGGSVGRAMRGAAAMRPGAAAAWAQGLTPAQIRAHQQMMAMNVNEAMMSTMGPEPPLPGPTLGESLYPARPIDVNTPRASVAPPTQATGRVGQLPPPPETIINTHTGSPAMNQPAVKPRRPFAPKPAPIGPQPPPAPGWGTPRIPQPTVWPPAPAPAPAPVPTPGTGLTTIPRPLPAPSPRGLPAPVAGGALAPTARGGPPAIRTPNAPAAPAPRGPGGLGFGFGAPYNMLIDLPEFGNQPLPNYPDLSFLGDPAPDFEMPGPPTPEPVEVPDEGPVTVTLGDIFGRQKPLPRDVRATVAGIQHARDYFPERNNVVLGDGVYRPLSRPAYGAGGMNRTMSGQLAGGGGFGSGLSEMTDAQRQHYGGAPLNPHVTPGPNELTPSQRDFYGGTSGSGSYRGPGSAGPIMPGDQYGEGMYSVDAGGGRRAYGAPGAPGGAYAPGVGAGVYGPDVSAEDIRNLDANASQAETINRLKGRGITDITQSEGGPFDLQTIRGSGTPGQTFDEYMAARGTAGKRADAMAARDAEMDYRRSGVEANSAAKAQGRRMRRGGGTPDEYQAAAIARSPRASGEVAAARAMGAAQAAENEMQMMGNRERIAADAIAAREANAASVYQALAGSGMSKEDLESRMQYYNNNLQQGGAGNNPNPAGPGDPDGTADGTDPVVNPSAVNPNGGFDTSSPFDWATSIGSMATAGGLAGYRALRGLPVFGGGAPLDDVGAQRSRDQMLKDGRITQAEYDELARQRRNRR